MGNGGIFVAFSRFGGALTQYLLSDFDDEKTVYRFDGYAPSDRYVPSIPSTPAAADTIYRHLCSTNTDVYDYDAIFTGDLGKVGSRLLYDLMLEKGIDIAAKHKDCGVMIFDDDQDVHAGGSGCGCCASVLCGHILRNMCMRKYRSILFIATGALLSPTTVLQKQTIPSIAHLVNIRI